MGAGGKCSMYVRYDTGTASTHWPWILFIKNKSIRLYTLAVDKKLGSILS